LTALSARKPSFVTLTGMMMSSSWNDLSALTVRIGARISKQTPLLPLRAAPATATPESRAVSFPPATAGDILSA
jgi:hypothetical protein